MREGSRGGFGKSHETVASYNNGPERARCVFMLNCGSSLKVSWNLERIDTNAVPFCSCCLPRSVTFQMGILCDRLRGWNVELNPDALRLGTAQWPPLGLYLICQLNNPQLPPATKLLDPQGHPVLPYSTIWMPSCIHLNSMRTNRYGGTDIRSFLIADISCAPDMYRNGRPPG